MTNHPIDVIIPWVDGSDQRLTEKRNLYLEKERRSDKDSGALATRFASNNEIKYCVLSILKFAPFVRNIFIVTDEQDPKVHDEVRKYFPDRVDTVKLVDHKEIFKGFEDFLPTFNSSSISTMFWRLDGLAENFVYINDDFFLIRDINPEEWFDGNRPVIRGKWLFPPLKKVLANPIKVFMSKHISRRGDYKPKISFYYRQWHTATSLSARFGHRYFFHCHTPYPMNRTVLANYFDDNAEVLKETIKPRFRQANQLLITALSNHLEILLGNRRFAKLNLGYFHPIYSRNRIQSKVKQCQTDSSIKSICVQSVDMFPADLREFFFEWITSILDLPQK
ncbi:MAG: Stealth CR1 domain-containing protein [Tenuifilaceae bacterium]|jgi:hypothetical protein|nr:Stealth CR1 domain-containing protein [Tenuifilaceae bacterium]